MKLLWHTSTVAILSSKPSGLPHLSGRYHIVSSPSSCSPSQFITRMFSAQTSLTLDSKPSLYNLVYRRALMTMKSLILWYEQIIPLPLLNGRIFWTSRNFPPPPIHIYVFDIYVYLWMSPLSILMMKAKIWAVTGWGLHKHDNKVNVSQLQVSRP